VWHRAAGAYDFQSSDLDKGCPGLGRALTSGGKTGLTMGGSTSSSGSNEKRAGTINARPCRVGGGRAYFFAEQVRAAKLRRMAARSFLRAGGAATKGGL